MFTFLVGLALGAAVTYSIGIKWGGMRVFWAPPTKALRNPSKYDLANADVARTLDDRDRYLAAFDARWLDGEEGEFARFTYADRDNVITERRISNWRSEGAYIEGVCLNRREGRTFRADRISDWSIKSAA